VAHCSHTHLKIRSPIFFQLVSEQVHSVKDLFPECDPHLL
jgi:hypothetical protein